MASLTCTPPNLQEVLTQLDLLQYHDALIEAGYENLTRFDTENNTVKELTEQLKEDVPMKKPHARTLANYLFSQQHQPLLLAPAAQNVDDDDLPIAEAIPMARVLNNPSSFDPACDPAVPSPQLMEKEMPDQMERDQEAANGQKAVWLKSLPVLDFVNGIVVNGTEENKYDSTTYEFETTPNEDKTIQVTLKLDEVSKAAIKNSKPGYIALYCGLESTGGIKVWDNGTDKVWCNDEKNILDCCALTFDLPTKPGRYELKLWEDKSDVWSMGYSFPLCNNTSDDQISIKFVVNCESEPAKERAVFTEDLLDRTKAAVVSNVEQYGTKILSDAAKEVNQVKNELEDIGAVGNFFGGIVEGGGAETQTTDAKETAVVSKDKTGHLISFVVPNNGFGCNGCKKKLPLGSTIHGCRSCNYDVCDDCFAAAAVSPNEWKQVLNCTPDIITDGEMVVLRVQPGLNSFSNAVKDAKRRGISNLCLENGVHDEKGEQVVIDFPLKVIGKNKDDVEIRASVVVEGKKEEDVWLICCTVTGANGPGVWGNGGAAVHLNQVCVEKCDFGVVVRSTTRNTMTDCNVQYNKYSGLKVDCGGRSNRQVQNRDGAYNGCMTIRGSATTIHHNVTSRKTGHYGLHVDPFCSIHLLMLNKLISTDNRGGGNCSGGDIKTIADTGPNNQTRYKVLEHSAGYAPGEMGHHGSTPDNCAHQ
jgi:hypothetical protein